LQIDRDLWLASDGSQIDDCMNHSCEPNLGFTTGEKALFSLRNIEAGEELTWDYSTSLNWPGWVLDCRCGARNCRGKVRSFQELDEATRSRLRSISLAYLR
jgi:hypothetical protein